MVQKSNGKTDASIMIGDRSAAPRADELTQDLLAWVGMAYAHKSYRGAMIGLGSGRTAHRLLAAPRLRSLDLIEIEQAVWEHSSNSLPMKARIYRDPRFHIQDARTHFATRDAPYDMILSEPSNPWVSGVSSLFTTEFYQDIRRRTMESDILIQLLQLYEFDSHLLLAILAALHENFPDVRIHAIPGHSGIVIVGSRHSPRPEAGILSRIEDAPRLAAFSLRPQVITAGSRLLSEEAIGRLLARRPPNSEFLPFVASWTERERFTLQEVDLVPVLLDGSAHFYQEILEPRSFAPRREAFLELLRTRLYTSPHADLRIAGLRRLEGLTRDKREQLIRRILLGSSRPWLWPARTDDSESAQAVYASIRRDPSSIFIGDAFLFSLQSVLGRRGSAETYRRTCLRRLPPNAPDALLKDLLIASILSKGRAAAQRLSALLRPGQLKSRRFEAGLQDLLIAEET